MKKIFIFIFLLAFFLRTYMLTSVPANVHIDEIAFGYNAYSIAETGKDEYGVFFPLQLKSYDDYRPALYSYLMIPFIKLVGLNIFSIRFTSVFISLGILIGIYLLVKEFIKKRKNEEIASFTIKPSSYIANSDLIPLLVTFLYAISPWSIFYSRLAIDTTAGQFFFVYGLLCFLRFINATNKKNYYLYLSTIFFLLCFYSYNGVKLFLPPFVLFLFYLYRKELWYSKKNLAANLLIAGIMLIPMVQFYINQSEGMIRFSSTNIFTQKRQLIDNNAQRLLIDMQNKDFLGYIYDNRRFAYFPIFITNYLVNFNPVWLYTSDGTENYKSSNIGLFYIFELPLLILGIYFIVKYSFLPNKLGYILILWILTAVLPSGFTTESPHATRSYNMLPPILIMEGFGLYYLMQIIKNLHNKYFRISGYLLVIFVGAFFILWFIHSYFVTFKRESSYKYQYGVREAIMYAKEHETEHKKIIFSNRGNLLFSYMYYLFFNAYNPTTYIKNGGTQSGTFDGNNIIGKYAFVNPNFYFNGRRDSFNKEAYESNDSSTLYIVDVLDIPLDPAFWENMEEVLKIKSLAGSETIFILQRKK